MVKKKETKRCRQVTWVEKRENQEKNTRKREKKPRKRKINEKKYL